jgi:hypothetical protein
MTDVYRIYKQNILLLTRQEKKTKNKPMKPEEIVREILREVHNNLVYSQLSFP